MKIRRGAVSLLLVLLGVTACGGDDPAGKARSAGVHHAAPAGQPGPAIELRRGRQPRELARIGLRGVWIGTEGGALEWKAFVAPRRADDAWYFLRLYAPFDMKSQEGDLAFRGHGRAKPDAVERRMILEWARQMATEAAGGRGSAAYGLVLAWHQGGPADICENVVLYLTGEAAATACGWEREVRGRLDPGQLARVFDWFDRLQPFQTLAGEPDESLRSGNLQSRLIFAGRGPRFSSPAEQEEIQSFAAALFTELSARRRGFVTPGLLLPPDAGSRAAEIVLELPEKAPPPPRPQPRAAPEVPQSDGAPQTSSSRRSRPQPVR
jgi:hypothetical protein